MRGYKHKDKNSTVATIIMDKKTYSKLKKYASKKKKSMSLVINELIRKWLNEVGGNGQ